MIGGVISLWTIGPLAQSSPPVSSRETQATPTFEKDILAIVENHCQQCHRPGQIGRSRSWITVVRAPGRDPSSRQCWRELCRRGMPTPVWSISKTVAA